MLERIRENMEEINRNCIAEYTANIHRTDLFLREMLREIVHCYNEILGRKNKLNTFYPISIQHPAFNEFQEKKNSHEGRLSNE